MSGGRGVDCIYVAASSRDARYARICVASLRCCYPEISIRLLAGGRLERGLASELRHYWGVEFADIPQGEYGWGFVKLEPLFGQPGERFLVLDSDTVITGPVLDLWRAEPASFLVDDERQSEADAKRLYYDWQKLKTTAPDVAPPQFVFNSGQWFGTAGVLNRDDFDPWLEWSLPRRLRHPELFMPGDQGLLNLVFNEQVRAGRVQVARTSLLRWPGHGLAGFDAGAVAAGACPPRVVHWAGLKKARHQDMLGADLLALFERRYYAQLPGGRGRLIAVACRDTTRNWVGHATTVARLACRRIRVSAGSRLVDARE
ncbi:MAG TPA: hypothetical protein VIC33_03960 [Vicinamibacterales bacterium]|jgi:hypothetical protein